MCLCVFLWRQSLKHIAWFRERHLSEITLGGLLILVLVRTIQYNLTRLRVCHTLHLTSLVVVLLTMHIFLPYIHIYMHTNLYRAKIIQRI